MTKRRHFLFLQGPHGPFFRILAERLNEAGHNTTRIAFNAGDRQFWSRSLPLVHFNAPQADWAAFFAEQIQTLGVSDLVLYGDMRFIHREAIAHAKTMGLRVHCFEEGYLRPYWISYERNGANAQSELMSLDMPTIRARRQQRHIDLQDAPATWGALWHHVWYGFVYHLNVALRNQRFSHYSRHRETPLWREVMLHFLRLIDLPIQNFRRDHTTTRFLRTGRPFFVVLLQLEHDASLVYHSDYQSQREFIDEICECFANAAPKQYQLVFKLHPLEDGRAPLYGWIKSAAQAHQIEKRVKVFHGGKLARLINKARGAITINSTAIQQVMWRGLPALIRGRSVFAKPEFASSQSCEDFFANPAQPDKGIYLEYRSYLLETSQISGSYYTVSGRAEILRKIQDMMLSEHHPYQHEEKALKN